MTGLVEAGTTAREARRQRRRAKLDQWVKCKGCGIYYQRQRTLAQKYHDPECRMRSSYRRRRERERLRNDPRRAAPGIEDAASRS